MTLEVTPVVPSVACYDLIRGCEACRLTAYLDPVGIPTIGWGHTSHSVRLGDSITQDQADTFLRADVGRSALLLSQWVVIPLNQNQFDALTSFVYNVGPGLVDHKDGFVWLRVRDALGAPRHSTLLNLLNEGELAAAAEQIPRWTRASGVVLPGLVKRRAAEASLFNSMEIQL